MKGKLVNLISSVRTLMRSKILLFPMREKELSNSCSIVPLIVINTLVIVYELVLG